MRNKRAFFIFPTTAKRGKAKSEFLPSLIQKFSITKRQRFIVMMLVLSTGLFFSEYLLGRSGLYVVIFLSALAAFLFYLSVYKDVKGSPSLYVFVLPLFVYTLAVGLFYFLVPARFISRIVITILYAIGLYSLSLSQNIFIVASLRTIPLLSGARIVSFVLTLLSYFFLTTVVFSLDLPLYIIAPLIFIFSFLAVLQSISITLEKSWRTILLWVFALSLCLVEMSLVLWLWPINTNIPFIKNFVIIAIFLTGFFYTIVGPSQVWLERRLFRGVMWEYIWIGVTIISVLAIFTTWRG